MGKYELTIQQYGKLAKLIEDSKVDSIAFNNADPVTEIVIKTFGQEDANRILQYIKTIFPNLEATVRFWDYENASRPMYCMCATDYQIDITIAVLPETEGSELVGI
jgi:hypothetical protein